MTNGIVVDSSILISYLNKDQHPKVELFKSLVRQNRVLFLPVILQEVLQGIREDKFFQELKTILLNYECIQYPPVEMAIEAAGLYRFLKRKGITIRKPNDCLIAAVCLAYKTPLLHNDVDFDQISKFTALKISK